MDRIESPESMEKAMAFTSNLNTASSFISLSMDESLICFLLSKESASISYQPKKM